ncbi:nucleotide-binding protein [Dechloromonas sp. XY25]|uniref:Nucleotide-binding protein n=1 Tax=Dechloromonas hankyongensis TaxID=2908002 RepID=A0ABS9JYK4_9RHOO|nr:nucleotide-binding protein [Dechloromonas hankyongensis]MCG2575973.1 nucleotide-binding protein [Dechloromonas hankyongensis]
MIKQDEAIALVTDLSQQLIKIANETRNTGDYQSGFERIRRWKERASNKISLQVNQLEGEKLKNKRKGSFRMGDPVGNAVDEAKMYLGFLDALLDELKNHPDEVLERPMPVKGLAAIEEPQQQRSSNAVFIVHGHDELNLLRTKELLRDRWGLEPIVLSGQPGKGRTIIEKFEGEAQRASFAFVLITPDDQIQKDESGYSQARPNVIFELGWFYGRLGRERVCILFKEGTKIHSDLDGVSRIQFKDSIAESIVEIEAELVEAGLLAI